MAVAPETGGRPLPVGPVHAVICAACGCRFESEGVETGARVRCPLCREVVEIGELVAAKRRYRSRSPRPLDDGRRIPRTTYRRSLRVLVLVAVIAGAAAALWRAWTADRSRVPTEADTPISPSRTPR